MDHKNLRDRLIPAFLGQQHGAKGSFHCKALSLLFCSPPMIQSTAASAKGPQSPQTVGNYKPTLRKVRFCRWKGRLGKPSRVGFKETPTGGGPRRECLVAWGKNCCSAGAVMLNPRRFPTNANTQHITSCSMQRREKIFYLYEQQVERGRACPCKTLRFTGRCMGALCSTLFSPHRTIWCNSNYYYVSGYLIIVVTAG